MLQCSSVIHSQNPQCLRIKDSDICIIGWPGSFGPPLAIHAGKCKISTTIPADQPECMQPLLPIAPYCSL